jgi:hypothetical protein
LQEILQVVPGEREEKLSPAEEVSQFRQIKDFDPDLHSLPSEKGFGEGNSLGPPGEDFRVRR